MCGIYFCRSEIPQTQQLDPGLLNLLIRRGPDSCQIIQRKVNRNSISTGHPPKDIFLTFLSTVLSLRGDTVVGQPLVDEQTGSLLCWNGEAWKIGNQAITGNDSQAVFDLMLRATQKSGKAIPDLHSMTQAAFVAAVQSIVGPFSFIFYDHNFQRIFYSRDILGRRSLLIKKERGFKEVAISSVSDGTSKEWVEVEPNGIYMMDLIVTPDTLVETDTPLKFPNQNSDADSCFPWNCAIGQPLTMPSLQAQAGFILNRDVPASKPEALHVRSNAVLDLEEKLQNSIKLRVDSVPRLTLNTVQLPCIAILFSGGVDCTLIARLIHEALPADCAVDLLNVAFENPRVVSAAKISSRQGSEEAMIDENIYDSCPDRITGLSSYEELLQQCPRRLWRFVYINIPYSETLAHRGQVISLIHPHDTEMDLSIAYALYFAARGSGKLLKTTKTASISYVTPSRVLFSGLGADELFGGYTRHATAFKRYGYSGLLDELSLDFKRLGKRNLGRDDRATSHWAREVRHPFLDDEFVSWSLALPIWEKCDFAYSEIADIGEVEPAPSLEPGKYLLRLLAWKLGMKRAAAEKKRAIQFGTRTAKMMSGKTKGTEVIA